jgi:hypothetical protein
MLIGPWRCVPFKFGDMLIAPDTRFCGDVPVTAPSLDQFGGRAIETAPRWHVTPCTLQVTLETTQSCDEPEPSGFFN